MDVKKPGLVVAGTVLTVIALLLSFISAGYDSSSISYGESPFWLDWYMPIDFTFSFLYGAYSVFELLVPVSLIYVIIKRDFISLLIPIILKVIAEVIYLIYMLSEAFAFDASYLYPVVWITILIAHLLVYTKVLRTRTPLLITSIAGSLVVIAINLAVSNNSGDGTIWIPFAYLLYSILLCACFGILGISLNNKREKVVAPINGIYRDIQGNHEATNMPDQSSVRPAGVQTIFCHTCGKENNAEAVFCVFCGNKLYS